MTADFVKLSQGMTSDTRDAQLKREIRENSGEIAKQLREKGVYENKISGLRISDGSRK
jgi:hypothetical protein